MMNPMLEISENMEGTQTIITTIGNLTEEDLTHRQIITIGIMIVQEEMTEGEVKEEGMYGWF